MTTFATEEAKVAVHLSLLLLLSQFAILSKFGREVGLVVVAGGADKQLAGVVGGPRVVVVGARVVFPVVHLAIGLHGFVRFISFTGTDGVLMADFGVVLPIAGINGLDKGMELVEVVQFANSCNFILDAAGKSIVELVAEAALPQLTLEESC